MSRTILKNTAGLLTATALTGALVLSSPGLAQAASGGNNSDTSRSTTDGTGNATAKAHAHNDGRLDVSTKARGADGDGGGLPGTPASTPTSADATAQVSKRVQVADGTYRVVITYKGLVGSENDRGENSEADVTRHSSARFISQSGGDDNRQVTRVQSISDRKGSKKTVLVIKVPDDASGFLRVKALLKGAADADGQGSFAKGTASTSGVSLKVSRI